MSSDRADRDLQTLLADLETTLDELQETLEDDASRGRRPPTAGEVLAFTRDYTIPTTIAVLETTIQSLELLRELLRLTGPVGESTGGRSRDVDAAADGVGRALDEVRAALRETDLPAAAERQGVVDEVRDLGAEIDRRLAEDVRPEESGDAGVTIDVQSEPAPARRVEDRVEAELDTLRDDIRDDGDDAPDDAG